MTTIIVKGANFSTGRIGHYSPPVEGASLCAFVGDADDATWLRNFGSGADLTLGAGKPSQVDTAFRRFNYQNYLKSAAYRTQGTTMLGVYRNPPGFTNFGIVLSSERDALDGGRRGCGLTRDSGTEVMYGTFFGTNASNASSSIMSKLPAVAGPAFIAGIVQPYAPTGAKVQTHRLTAPASTAATSAVLDTDHQPDVDEAAFPFFIGHHHRPVVLGDIDIGFVAVFPRVLSLLEIDTMYQSVKKRFAALGVTI